MITKIPIFYVFGANTDVGKTIFSAGLCYAAINKQLKTCYIKPIQTGYPTMCDATFIKEYTKSNLLKTKTYVKISEPVSPHRVPAEEKIIEQLKNEIESTDVKFMLVEGAGGIASPFLDGRLQCDVYRQILLPVIFIADSKLGGISTTISSIELAQSRGFEIACVLLFEGENENSAFLTKYFDKKIPVISFSNLRNEQEKFSIALNIILSFHGNKIERTKNCIQIAKENVWWPFTQHQDINKAKYIDSALNDEVCFYAENMNSTNIDSTNSYDASASWWTQGIGHASVALTKAASFAAGRYGHVLFPGNIHEPAAKLTEKLLNTVGSGWAKRVFFSDNGSTANEIAIKMAFRKSFGKEKNILNPAVLGLKNSYHGDTLAAMDATNPNTFKKTEHWYNPRGYWLNYPKIFMKNKKYVVQIPTEFMSSCGLSNIEQIFSSERINSDLAYCYLKYIENQFKIIFENKLNIGACLLEGVVMGSGGMQFVDPLFQKILIQECQKNKIPVILDEVFTGFWRLGKMSAAQMLNVKPDIACYGKLLTGGLLPMAVTLASEEIFNSFLGDNLSSALLHGHSYTATPVGCNVSCEAIEEIFNSLHFNKSKNELNEIWDNEYVEKISALPNIERVFALGSLFALELKDAQADYSSTIAKDIISKLKQNNVDARPLGNVIYIIAGYNSEKFKIFELLRFVFEILVSE